MKPSQQRASHPETVNPRWIAGKAVFADLIAGKSTVGLLSTEDFSDAMLYSKNLLFPPSGGVKVRAAIRAEAIKRGMLP